MFSYSPQLLNDTDRIRFNIADTVKDQGPRPQDKNFEDDELAALAATEGSWQRAVAAALEALAVEWRKFPNLESDQFGLSRSHISRGFADDAKRWREKWGYAGEPISATGARYGLTRGYVRVDGYGDDETVGE